MRSQTTLVVYRSKTGFTKKYAEWIAEELDADLKHAADVSTETLLNYENIVYGGGLYAAGINGIGLIKTNLPKLRSKKIAVFATGCTPPRQATTQEIMDKNFSASELQRLHFFYMRGGFDYSRLGLVDKIAMSLLKIKLKNKKHPTADDKGMLALYGHPVDFSSRRNIQPLVDYMRS
jgi:menaquinone-dependent protoporphyrinogen IX oxidase